MILIIDETVLENVSEENIVDNFKQPCQVALNNSFEASGNNYNSFFNT